MTSIVSAPHESDCLLQAAALYMMARCCFSSMLYPVLRHSVPMQVLYVRRRHLSSIDLQACRARQVQMRRVRRLEDQAATALGVSAVFAEDERLAMLPSFSDFLRRALADCTQHGAVGGGRHTKLPLRVQRHGYRADAAVGLLAVPVTASAAQLRVHIEVTPGGPCRAVSWPLPSGLPLLTVGKKTSLPPSIYPLHAHIMTCYFACRIMATQYSALSGITASSSKQCSGSS